MICADAALTVVTRGRERDAVSIPGGSFGDIPHFYGADPLRYRAGRRCVPQSSIFQGANERMGGKSGTDRDAGEARGVIVVCVPPFAQQTARPRMSIVSHEWMSGLGWHVVKLQSAGGCVKTDFCR